MNVMGIRKVLISCINLYHALYSINYGILYLCACTHCVCVLTRRLVIDSEAMYTCASVDDALEI